MLLEAETEATRIVKEAREGRVELLKQAKQLAEQAIDDYKKNRQREFEDATSSATDGTSDIKSKINTEKDAQLAKIMQAKSANGPAVVDYLLQTVMTVDVEGVKREQ